MARKQKASVFNKFLDLIGIVDTAEDEQQGDAFDEDFDTTGRSSGRNGGSVKNARFNDEFDNEPRMSRVQNKRTASSGESGRSSAHFDADEGWGDNAGRPEYGARTQQRAQSKTRPASSRYGSEQRPGANAGSRNSRFETSDYDGGYYKSNNSYQEYQPGSYRQGSSAYGSYGSNSRSRYDADAAYGYASEQKEMDASAHQQRHQTVIFKLHSVDECKGVIMALIEKKSVLLNLDELDSLQAQRTLDTMSGATFAIGARLSRASDRTWLITPSTVDVNDKQNDSVGEGAKYSGRYY